VADEPVKRCKSGKHDLVGDNKGVSNSTGRSYCKACKLAYKREVRKKAGKCPRKLHSFANPDNVFTTVTGQRRCRPCALAAKKAKADAAATAAAAAAALTPPRLQRAMSPRLGGHGSETEARYRLAVQIRRGRGIDV